MSSSLPAPAKEIAGENAPEATPATFTSKNNVHFSFFTLTRNEAESEKTSALKAVIAGEKQADFDYLIGEAPFPMLPTSPYVAPENLVAMNIYADADANAEMQDEHRITAVYALTGAPGPAKDAAGSSDSEISENVATVPNSDADAGRPRVAGIFYTARLAASATFRGTDNVVARALNSEGVDGVFGFIPIARVHDEFQKQGLCGALAGVAGQDFMKGKGVRVINLQNGNHLSASPLHKGAPAARAYVRAALGFGYAVFVMRMTFTKMHELDDDEFKEIDMSYFDVDPTYAGSRFGNDNYWLIDPALADKVRKGA